MNASIDVVLDRTFLLYKHGIGKLVKKTTNKILNISCCGFLRRYIQI